MTTTFPFLALILLAPAVLSMRNPLFPIAIVVLWGIILPGALHAIGAT